MLTAQRNDAAPRAADVRARELPAELWPDLAEAMEAAAAVDALGASLANPQMLVRPLHLAEAVASLLLDGVETSVRDTLLFEVRPPHSAYRGEATLRCQAASNVTSAIRDGAELLDERPFSGRLLRSVHSMLTFQLPESAAWYPVEDDGSPSSLAPLERELGADPPRHRRLTHAFETLWRLTIDQPFPSFNERLARSAVMLMIRHLHRHVQPWIGLSGFFAARREETRKRCSVGGDDWQRFCLQGTAKQARGAVGLLRRLNVLKSEFDELADSGRLGPRGKGFVDLLMESPVASMPLIQHRLDLPFNTAKRDVQRLCEQGLLSEIASDGVRVFECRRILEAWMERSSE
jgi:Fic family protein